MTDQEFYTVLGYLSNPIRETNIEVELPSQRQTRFISEYASWTNNHPLPVNTSTAPYYVWPVGTNKYGLEVRLYFISNNNMPQILDAMLEPRKIQNRPSYENWERRISLKDHIIPFLQKGFVLGRVQDKNRIRTFVPAQFFANFEYGYNL